MSIAPACVICDEELDKPGGLLISPPQPVPTDALGDVVHKLHVCMVHYTWLVRLIEGMRDERPFDGVPTSSAWLYYNHRTLYDKISQVLTSDGVNWWLHLYIEVLGGTPHEALVEGRVEAVEALIDSYLDPSYG